MQIIGKLSVTEALEVTFLKILSLKFFSKMKWVSHALLRDLFPFDAPIIWLSARPHLNQLFSAQK